MQYNFTTSILLISLLGCSYADARTPPAPSSLHQYTNYLNSWYSTEGGYEGFSNSLNTTTHAQNFIKAAWVSLSGNYQTCTKNNNCIGVVFLYYSIANIINDRIELVPTNWDIQTKQPQWSKCYRFDPNTNPSIIEPGHSSNTDKDQLVCECTGPDCQFN